MVSEKLSFELVREGWGLVRSRWNLWIPAMLVWFAILLSLDQLERRIGSAGLISLTGLLGKGISLLVNAFLTGGMVQIALKQVRGEAPVLGDLFSGGRFFLTIATREVLMSLSVFVPTVLVMFLPYFDRGLGSGGFLVGAVVIGLIGLVALAVMAVRWMIADVLIVDQGMGAWEALGESWRALSLDSGTVVLIGLALMGLQIPGFLTCGIGLLFTLPLVWVVPVLVYRHYYPNWFTPKLETGGDKVE